MEAEPSPPGAGGQRTSEDAAATILAWGRAQMVHGVNRACCSWALVLLAVFTCAPAAGQQTQENDSVNNEPRLGLDLVHAGLWVGPSFVLQDQEYEIIVRDAENHRGGDTFFGLARAGVGGAVAGSFGLHVTLNVTAGVELAYGRYFAPRSHKFLDRVHAELDPWMDLLYVGPVVRIPYRKHFVLTFGASYAVFTERFRRKVVRPDTLRREGVGAHATVAYRASLSNQLHYEIGPHVLFSLQESVAFAATLRLGVAYQ